MSTPGPMNPLQVQLFAGAAAGRRARFDRSPITFGRDPTNVLVVEDATVSRRHGEIRFEGGLWVLANQSENGTKVNRKNVTDKPLPLKSGDEVYVGGKLLFNVTIEPVEGAAGEVSLAAGAEQPAEGDAPAPKKRKKLMIGIGVYMFAMLLLVIFLSSLGKNQQSREANVPELTKDQIATLISEPLPRELHSEPRYRHAINEGNRLYERRLSSPGGLYDAYEQYRIALSVSGRDDNLFPPEDLDAQAKYRQVQLDLIERFDAIYRDACNALNRGDNQSAYDGFDKLKDIFKDGNSPLTKNVQDKQNIAVKRKGKGKFKK